MGRLFDNPMILILILLVILLLFGAPKLPGMARSLGQSLRIFKSEVKEMKEDDKDRTVVNGESSAHTTGSSPSAPHSSESTNASSATSSDAGLRNESDGLQR